MHTTCLHGLRTLRCKESSSTSWYLLLTYYMCLVSLGRSSTLDFVAHCHILLLAYNICNWQLTNNRYGYNVYSLRVIILIVIVTAVVNNAAYKLDWLTRNHHSWSGGRKTNAKNLQCQPQQPYPPPVWTFWSLCKVNRTTCGGVTTKKRFGHFRVLDLYLSTSKI